MNAITVRTNREWIALVLALGIAGLGQAQTFTWDAGGGNANWGQANNFDPNGTPPAGSVAAFVFDQANIVASPSYAEYWRPNNNVADDPMTFTSLTISGSDAAWNTTWVGGWDIRGNAFILAGGIAADGGTHRIGSSFTLSDNVSMTVTDESLRINSAISQTGGDRSLTKAGNGTLILGGINAYAGGTAINAGVLQLTSVDALGSAGTISFGGGTMEYSASNNTDYSSRFSTAAGQAININTAGRDVVFASNLISSGGSLAKAGAGTLTLSGNNTYSGGTTLSGGTLDISENVNALGTGTLTLGTGTTLNANNASRTTYANNIVINGNVSLTGLRTTYNGTIDLGSATRTLTVANSVDNGNLALIFDGVVSGSGGLVKAGTGILSAQRDRQYVLRRGDPQ